MALTSAILLTRSVSDATESERTLLSFFRPLMADRICESMSLSKDIANVDTAVLENVVLET